MRALTHLLFSVSLGLCAACGSPTTRLRPPSSDRDARRMQPAEPRLIDAALARDDAHWVRHDTEHFRLHAERGSYAAAHFATLGEAAERARHDDLAHLGGASYPSRVTLLLVGSREAMRRFVGWPAGGWAVAEENGAFFVASDTLAPALRHELMHVFSWNLWGAPFGGPAQGQWISEGVATDAVGGCHGIGLHTLAATYERAGQIVPWTALPTGFDVRTIASYIEAGSIVQYVRERYGVGAVQRLWQAGPIGLQAATGTSADALERDWRSVLASAPPLSVHEPLTVVAERIRREGCER